jgi:uncharacterized damage-inducible protein DinB
MNSTQTRAVADFLVADFANEMQTTVRVIEAVPSDRSDYSPDPKSKSALGLVRHLALEDEWLLSSIANGAFTAFPDESDACGIMNAADGAAHYREKVAAALDRVRAVPDDKLTAVIGVPGVMEMTTLEFLAVALKHSIHHRGQLSTYLRAMGGKVPGIYGPSADTQ